jgi:hypothetical protein
VFNSIEIFRGTLVIRILALSRSSDKILVLGLLVILDKILFEAIQTQPLTSSLKLFFYIFILIYIYIYIYYSYKKTRYYYYNSKL